MTEITYSFYTLNKDQGLFMEVKHLVFIPLAVLVYSFEFNSTYILQSQVKSLWVICLVQNKVNKYVCHIALKQPQYFEVTEKSINQIENELLQSRSNFTFSQQKYYCLTLFLSKTIGVITHHGYCQFISG